MPNSLCIKAEICDVKENTQNVLFEGRLLNTNRD